MSEDVPVFGGLHFYVRDIHAAIGFYQLVVLAIDPSAADGGFVNVDLGNGCSFAFATDDLTRMYDPAFEPPPHLKSAVALQFDLPSRAAVDEMHARLTGAGHASHLAPIDAFWGSRYAEVLDPDGNVVGFHSPRAARG